MSKPSRATAAAPAGERSVTRPLQDAPSGARPLSLLDMPGAWLQHLPAALTHHDARVALSRTCKAMRGLVLSQCSLVVTIQLPLKPHQQEAALNKVLLACKSSPRVHLKLICDPPMSVLSTGTSSILSMDPKDLLTSAMKAAGGPLKAITHVTFKRVLDLHGFVPPWLIKACPNMTCCCLIRCHFSTQPAPPTATIPQCPQLKTLQLSELQHLPSSQHWWQQQLGALPGLTSLDLDGDTADWQGVPDGTHSLLQRFSVIGSQLTQLSLYGEQPWFQWVAGLFPILTELLLYRTMDDEGMEVLLSMHSLKHLLCRGFQLQHSYTHRPCTWTHLGFTELDVASFGLLPLRCLERFEVPDSEIAKSPFPIELVWQDFGTRRAATLIVTPSPDLAVNERVAAAVVRCGGIQTGEGTGQGPHVGLGVLLKTQDGLASTATCLAALMPMLSASKVRMLGLFPNVVTIELLAILKQNLPCLACIMCPPFTHAPELWPLLLPSLPPSVQHVQLLQDGVGGMTEAQVTEMCVHAIRPVEVSVVYGVCQDAKFERRIKAAMAAAGHQHVKLSVHARNL